MKIKNLIQGQPHVSVSKGHICIHFFILPFKQNPLKTFVQNIFLGANLSLSGAELVSLGTVNTVVGNPVLWAVLCRPLSSIPGPTHWLQVAHCGVTTRNVFGHRHTALRANNQSPVRSRNF